MNKETLNFAKRLIVDSIWKSANLEGLGTTFPKTEAILENIPTETKKEEVLFIINMKRAWDFLLQNIDYPNCIMLLREYNKVVGENLYMGNGEIRKSEVFIGGTTWKPAIPTENEIHEKIKELNSIADVELKALKYFCYVARTQMFIDGNKRVAQLIANKILIENDIGVFQIPIEALEPFKGLLLRFYETNDDTEIISFMKEYCIVRVGTGVKQYKEKKEYKIIEISESFKMSESQVRILNKILYNLRLELSYRGITYAELYESKDRVFLSLDNVKYKMHSGDNKLDFLINKTISLLVDKVPLPLKKVSFCVSDKYDLVYGDFIKSEEEKGSVELKLW